MKQVIQNAVRLVKRCLKTVFLFEFLFYLFSSYIFFPACRWIFNSCLEWTGLYYLTQENLLQFLKNPVMILCSLLIAFLFCLVTMLEISCVITCLHTSKTRLTLDIFQSIYEGGKDMLRMLCSENFALILVTAFLVPFLQLFTTTSPLRRINLPWQALAEYAFQEPYVYLTAAYALGVIAILWFAPNLYHRYILENCTVKEALSANLRMKRGVKYKFWTRLKRLLTLLSCALVVSIALVGGLTLVSAGLNFLIRQIIPDLNAAYHVWRPLSFLLNFFENAAPKVFFYACLSALYYKSKREAGEPLPGQAIPIRSHAGRFNGIVFYTVLALTAGSFILYDTVLRPILVRYDVLEYIDDQTTLIVAHRGSADGGDENTLYAIENAYKLGADYIEVDVQQTSDGVVIVNHDNTFHRVFKDGRGVWEVSFDETQKLQGRNSGQHPPSLYEVLSMNGGQGNLMIELKNNGHNPDLARAVYDVLVQYDSLDRCVIQSSSYRMLKEFKALAPEVRCGYILSFALGHYASLEAADFFSLDSDFVNEEVLHALRRKGKKLFVWTVNDEERMKELRDMGVDGIITDDVPLAKAALYSAEELRLEDLTPQEWMPEGEASEEDSNGLIDIP